MTSTIGEYGSDSTRGTLRSLAHSVGLSLFGRLVTVISKTMIGKRVVVKELEYEIAKDNLKILRRVLDRNITKVMIPADVCEIGEKCFHLCGSLCEVTFETGSKLQRIEKSAFSQTDLKKMTIPSSVEVIGESCFHSCVSLSEVTFEGKFSHTVSDSQVTFETGSKLQRIEELAFWQTGLKKMTIPSSVEVIGENCFRLCESLREVTFEGSVHGLAESAFNSCLLQVVRIPLGEKLNVNLPRTCRIEYFEVRPPTTISDLIIDLDSKYEEVTDITELELEGGNCSTITFVRDRETGKEFAVKTL
jgi:hypothetical protein